MQDSTLAKKFAVPANKRLALYRPLHATRALKFASPRPSGAQATRGFFSFDENQL